MSAVTLTGVLVCRDDAEAAVVTAHLDEHVRLTRAEAGCLAFDVDAAEEPGMWRVSERFVDAEAFHLHQRRAVASAWGLATAGIERRYTVTGIQPPAPVDPS